MKKAVLIVVKIAFIVGVFFFLFNSGLISVEQLKDVFANLDAKTATLWLTFAAVVKLGGIFCGVLRWHFLLMGQGIRLPFWYLTKCWFMGRAIGLLLPGTVGLDGYRLVESAAYTGEVIKCTTVVAVEKLIGFVALAVLVFLTLPLGGRLFDFNYAVLGIVLTILFCFIATAFLLLLNPRIVQVLVAVLPVPGAIRHKVNKLGVAITAYSGQRGTLLFAVLLGLGIHLGIVLMYFGTAMAFSGGTADMGDVLFASPLIIVGSIIAPTVSGVGVREGVMTVLLGAKYGDAAAFLFGHIALWIGEMVPFLLSLPLLLFATRPDRAKFLAELDTVRAESGDDDEDLHLSPEEVADYRGKLIDSFGAGILGGLIGGTLFGLAEAIWHMNSLGSPTDSAAYLWAPVVYGFVFSGVGFGIGAGLVFLYLLFNHFSSGGFTFGFAMGGTVALVGIVIGRFRYVRDILGEGAMSNQQNIMVIGAALAIGLVVAVIGIVAARVIKGGRIIKTASALAAYSLVLLIGFGLSAALKPKAEAVTFSPEIQSDGPNIILIAVDTLRADFLQPYNYEAQTKTPNVNALAADSILFDNAFAQSSWTKASFGTIFSGLYPEAHTATGKVSALPQDVTTIAEALNAGGYYTRGYSNNPNITSIFNYNQGFVEYTDLKPSLYFGATASSEKLVLYDILRKVVQVFNAKILRGRINITDFYQPADQVTDVGLNWLDGEDRPSDAPFFLFMHYMDPHDPFRDPNRPGKGYARVQMANPDPEKYLDIFKESYSYEIEYMDTHVGRLLEGLKERGLYEDTLIVFTADHGEEFYEHGGWWHGLSLYDEQIKIPLMMKLPKGQLKGLHNYSIARHVDIAPTLAQFASVAASDDWQGAPLLTQDLAAANDEVAYTHGHLDFEGIKLKSLRTIDRKLITANEGNKRDYAPVEFYDLVNDPGEQINLAEEGETEQEMFTKTLGEMDDFISKGAKQPAGFNMDDLAEEERARLESLGYLGGDEDAPSDEDATEEDTPEDSDSGE